MDAYLFPQEREEPSDNDLGESIGLELQPRTGVYEIPGDGPGP